MKIKLLFFLILLFLPLTIFTQTRLNSFNNIPKEFRFELDYAGFRHENRYVFLEVYYSFFRNQLEFVEGDSQKVAQFNVNANIFQKDSLWFSRNWSNKYVLSEDEVINKNKKLFTLTNFTLPPGHYRYVTTIKDVRSGLEGIKEIELNLKDYSHENLIISDIELSSAITQDTTNGLFTKNNYRVIPNPSALYGLERPMLYYYTEIYNLSQQLNSTYSVEYAILDSDGNEFRTFPKKVRKKPGTSLVEVGAINVITFPTGKYYFELRVSDMGNFSQASQRKTFYIYRTGETLTTAPSVRTTAHINPLIEYYKNVPQEIINEEFESATYVATKEEKRIFKTLDLEGKRKFIAEFWLKRDNTPQTTRNEFREEYLARVRFANKHYGGFKKGWKTDRGRIILKYGRPDEIERNPSRIESRGYEIWQYFKHEGGVIFIFVDKGGLQDYELVHSTARGEIYDPDWMRWLSVR